MTSRPASPPRYPVPMTSYPMTSRPASPPRYSVPMTSYPITSRPASPPRYSVPMAPRSPSPRRFSRTTSQEDLDLALAKSMSENLNNYQEHSGNVNDLEDDFLAAAIAASLEAVDKSNVAVYEADRVLVDEQDEAYEASLAIDKQKDQKDQAVREAASRAALAAKLAAEALQVVQMTEKAKANLTPPVLMYSIQNTDQKDLMTLGFRLPKGGMVTHVFHKSEPLSSVLQQVRFDTKHIGLLELVVPPNNKITCPVDTPLAQCGVSNRDLVLVLTV